MLPAPAPSAAAPAPTTLDRSTESTLSALYTAAIGPVNTAYYLPIFEHFEQAGRAGPSWNRAACLCTLNWLLFRRMWTAALAYAAVLAAAVLLIEGLGRGMLQWSGNTEWSLLAVLALAAFGLPGVWGNALLHRHVRRRMHAAIAASKTLAEARALLQRQSSSRQRLLGIAWANAALLSVLLALWPAWRASHAPGADIRSAGVPAARMQEGPVASAPAATAPVAHRAASASAPAASIEMQTLAASAPASAAPGSAAQPAAASSRAASASGPAEHAEIAPDPAARAPAAAAASVAAPQRTTSVPVPAAKASAAAPSAERRVGADARPGPGPGPDDRAAARNTTPGASAPTVAGARTDDAVSPRAASRDSRYYINVGLFAEAGNARRAYEKLQQAGVAAFVQELDTPKGRRARVRAGPYASREQAESAAEQIRALQLEAQVFEQL